MQQAAAATRAVQHVGGGGFLPRRDGVKRFINAPTSTIVRRSSSRRSGAGVRVEAANDSVSISAPEVQTRESRKDGRPVYSPDSYQDLSLIHI